MIEKRLIQGTGFPVSALLVIAQRPTETLFPLAALIVLSISSGSSLAATTNPSTASPTSAAPATQVELQERMRVTVKRGESVSALIRRTLPNSPYRDNFLRQAFHRMNPDAYVENSPFRLKHGAVMVVPSHNDLQRMASGELSPPAAASATQTRPELERKGWVRYP